MDSENEYVVDIENDSDDGESSSSEEEGAVLRGSPASTTGILNAESTGRVFLVSRVERASGGFRPHFLFNGELVEVLPGMDGGCRMERVLNTSELQLSLRFEPPSPKFTRTCQGMVSYRLKLLDGQQFIYLQRGLPKVLCVDEHVRAVSWGQLQLVFNTEQQLLSFLKVLRHVQVVHDKLWPREVAALWGIPCHTESMDLQAVLPSTQAPEQHQDSESYLGRTCQWVQQHKVVLLVSAATGTLLLTLAAYMSMQRGKRTVHKT